MAGEGIEGFSFLCRLSSLGKMQNLKDGGRFMDCTPRGRKSLFVTSMFPLMSCPVLEHRDVGKYISKTTQGFLQLQT